MDKMKSESGFTILESLVGILILGIMLILFAVFFNQIFNNPKLLHRSEAFILAKQEIEKCKNKRLTKDTLYFNEKENLSIVRDINLINNIINAKVTVETKLDKKKILSLSVEYLE